MTLILHIGSPKTATSTLQKAFFPKHPELFFLGKEVDEERGWTGWMTSQVSDLMLALERSHLDFNPDMTIVSSILENIRDQAAGRIVVISSEDICLFSGVDPIVKLERIKNIFGTLGPIRIILAVRDQVSLIKSIYLTEHRGEMLNIPGTQQTWFPNFDQYIDIHFRYACGSVLESFRFAANLERYRKWAGIDNVYTYSFDDFKKNQEGSLRKICQFIGIDDNDACLHLTARTRENSHHSSRAYLATTLRKRLFGDFSIGQFFPMPIRLLLRRWITSGPAHSVNISSRSLNRLRDYYSADNQLLKERYDISLNI